MGKVGLSSAAHVIVRPGACVQFGVDATRAGIIDCLNTKQVGAMIQAFLKVQHSPISVVELETLLLKTGLNEAAAKSLINDLLAYRILIPSKILTPAVAVFGRSTLAHAVTTLLAAHQIRVRRPRGGVRDSEFLDGLDPSIPVVLIDRLSHGRHLSRALVARNYAVLQAGLIDAHGVLGPHRILGQGPCPLCVDLHRTDADPHWPAISAQAIGAPNSPDPVLVSLIAARVVADVLCVVEAAPTPPGFEQRTIQPGILRTIEPYSGADIAEEIPSHPSCPACFYG